jgi:hypothetical protein
MTAIQLCKPELAADAWNPSLPVPLSMSRGRERDGAVWESELHTLRVVRVNENYRFQFRSIYRV